MAIGDRGPHGLENEVASNAVASTLKILLAYMHSGKTLKQVERLVKTMLDAIPQD